MNGELWTRSEIDELCRTAIHGGDLLALSEQLRRTHEAVIAKARRLALPVGLASSVPGQLQATLRHERYQGSLHP